MTRHTLRSGGCNCNCVFFTCQASRFPVGCLIRARRAVFTHNVGSRCFESACQASDTVIGTEYRKACLALTRRNRRGAGGCERESRAVCAVGGCSRRKGVGAAQITAHCVAGSCFVEPCLARQTREFFAVGSGHIARVALTRFPCCGGDSCRGRGRAVCWTLQTSCVGLRAE